MVRDGCMTGDIYAGRGTNSTVGRTQNALCYDEKPRQSINELQTARHL